MSVESRVEYLLRAASRAQREGNLRLATVLRRMAEELLPAESVLEGVHLPIPSELTSRDKG